MTILRNLFFSESKAKIIFNIYALNIAIYLHVFYYINALS